MGSAIGQTGCSETAITAIFYTHHVYETNLTGILSCVIQFYWSTKMPVSFIAYIVINTLFN